MQSQSHPSMDLLSDLMVHGGRLSTAMAAYPNAPKPWLDLSTGLNPVAYPVQPVSSESLAALPDPQDLDTLIMAARTAYAVADGTGIIAVPGTDLAISMMPHLLNHKCRVGIVSPTYLSHERSWKAAGHDVVAVSRTDELTGFDVAIMVNPNNPDGRLTSSQDIRRLADELQKTNGLLVVDEAFIEVCGPASLATLANPPASLVVLRSFGKFYGLAGVRLGFVIGRHPIVHHVSDALGAWPISATAITAGRQALRDNDWAVRTKARLVADAERLDEILRASGGNIIGGTSLFRLVTHHAARRLFEHLAQAGILVRPFRDAPDRLRFGLPPDAAGFARLDSAINAFQVSA